MNHTASWPQATLDAVAVFCTELRSHAQALVSQDLVTDDAVVVSAGGSAYLDVVLPRLGGPLRNMDASPRTVLPIVRSGRTSPTTTGCSPGRIPGRG